MTLQLSIGGMVVPIQPIRSMSEAFFRLRQTLRQSSLGSLNMAGYGAYCSYEFVVGFPLEKVPEASFSGVSTRVGESCVLTVNNIPTQVGGEPPALVPPLISGVYLHFVFDSIASVSGAGVELQC